MSRYKLFTKGWLLVNGVKVFIDGVDTTSWTREQLNEIKDTYKTFQIFQTTPRNKGRYLERKPIPNNKNHSKGINKNCTYYQVGLAYGPKGHRATKGIPLHRIVYVWFKDLILPYNFEGEKMDICHIDHDWKNCHFSNLKWDTHKNNLAERTGAINQYGKRKNERD